MKLGIALPSIMMTQRFNDRIFSPKVNYLELVNGLSRSNQVFAYTAAKTNTSATLVPLNSPLEERDMLSAKDKGSDPSAMNSVASIRSAYEFEQQLLEHSFSHATKEKIDLMHLYYLNHGSFNYDYLNFPVVTTLHESIPPENTMERLRYNPKNSMSYVAISDLQKRQFEENLGIKIQKRIHNGINLNSYGYVANPSADYYITIGRYIPEKGISDAIQASVKMGKLLKIASSKNFKDAAYYMEKIFPFLGSEFIQEFDYIEYSKKLSLLGNARAFLFPISWEEPFGMVMLEAMACGTPVIAYAQGSVPEVIRDGVTGFIINPSEQDIRGNFITKRTGIDGLMEAMQRIESLPHEEYERMRMSARRHVEENFTIERMVKEYEEVYQQIISARPQST